MLADKLRAVSFTKGVQYVGGYTLGFAGQTTDRTITFGGNLTGGLESSAREGDLVIVYFGTGSTVDNNLVVSGYTELVELFRGNTSAVYDTNLVIAYKFMGPTPDTSFVLTGGTLSIDDGGAVAVQVWRNVDPIMPFDVKLTTSLVGNTALVNPPAITPNTAGSIVVAGGAGAHGGTGTFTSSDLSGFISSQGTDLNRVTVGLGYKVWESGSFDPAQFGGLTANANQSYAAATLALRSPTEGTPPEFIASAQTQTTAVGTTLVINKPTGTLENDLMIAFMANDGNASWSGDTGWTEVLDYSNSTRLRIAYKVAGASEPSTYTFTASTSQLLSGVILTYRGAVYDAIGAVSTANTVTGPTSGADYSRLICFAARENNNTSLVSNMDNQRAIDNDDKSPSWVVYDELVSAGPTGDRTVSGVTDASVLLTIRPS